MKNLFNQFECREAKAGDIVLDTEQTGNILLFVTAGKLLICAKTSTPAVEVDEGYFVLLPAEIRYTVTAITDVETIIMHAGTLSAMITEDPEWNTDQLVILQTCSSLKETLVQLEAYQKEKRSNLN